MKLIIIFMATGILLVGFAQPVGASTPITIEGTVTDAGVPVPGKKVGIDCFGKLFANFIGFAISDGGGQYVIHTDSSLCPISQSVMVNGDKDGDGVYESAAVGVVTTATTVNLQLGKNFAVPEYEWLTSGLAVLSGVGTVLAVRRHRRGESRP